MEFSQGSNVGKVYIGHISENNLYGICDVTMTTMG